MESEKFRREVDGFKSRVDIVEVVRKHVELDQNLKGICPFHDDTKPSFSVNRQGQYFHCFGCGAGGDVIKFVERIDGVSFREAIRKLAAEYGVTVPLITPADLKTLERERAIESVRNETVRFYEKRISPEAMQYLTNGRGLEEETIKKFRLGYADGELKRHLVQELKIPIDLCVEAGVLKQHENGSARDFFYNRIIIPNLKQGRVVGISGRSLDGGKPKYLNLPGPISNLFNEDALAADKVVVAEGQFDVVASEQAGNPAVGVFSASSFRESLVSKFSRCSEIYICTDNDEAGRKGALKIAEQIGERARIVKLPLGLDINDYLRDTSPEDFRRLLENSVSTTEYKIGLIPTKVKKTNLLRYLEPVLQDLAVKDEPQSEAILKNVIAPRFSFDSRDTESYRKLIKEKRKGKLKGSRSGKKDPAGKTDDVTARFDGLVDLVESNGDVAFLIKEGDGLLITADVVRNLVRSIPPAKNKIPWMLPNGGAIITHYDRISDIGLGRFVGELYDDLVSYHKSISELPREEMYDLFAVWDFHSFLPEKFNFSPVLYLFAIPERGKTRTGKGLTYVGYRGIHVESLRDPYIIRVAEYFGATLFFDVRDLWRKAERLGCEDIVLHRFEKGVLVPRVNRPEQGPHKDIDYYKVFGPTIIATNRPVDEILETRALTINMPDSRRTFENDVTPETALPLKERLLAFRAAYLDRELPDIKKPVPGRLGDITKPLVQTVRAVKPDHENRLLALISDIKESRSIIKAGSREGELIGVIRTSCEKVNRNLLLIKDIAEGFNSGKIDRFYLGNKAITGMLRALGFETTRGERGATAIVWNEELIRRLSEDFGLSPPDSTGRNTEGPEGIEGNEGAEGF